MSQKSALVVQEIFPSSPATHCNTLQHTAPRCNTLHHTRRVRKGEQQGAHFSQITRKSVEFLESLSNFLKVCRISWKSVEFFAEKFESLSNNFSKVSRISGRETRKSVEFLAEKSRISGRFLDSLLFDFRTIESRKSFAHFSQVCCWRYYRLLQKE